MRSEERVVAAAAAGTPTHVFPLAPTTLATATTAQVTTLRQSP